MGEETDHEKSIFSEIVDFFFKTTIGKIILNFLIAYIISLFTYREDRYSVCGGVSNTPISISLLCMLPLLICMSYISSWGLKRIFQNLKWDLWTLFVRFNFLLFWYIWSGVLGMLFRCWIKSFR